MNEEEIAEQRRSLTRRILAIQVKVAASKHSFFNGGAETPLAIRSQWALEIAELELARHDVESRQTELHKQKKAFRTSNVHDVLLTILRENKLDRYVTQAIARCDEMRATA